MSTVLIIEDEKDLAELLAFNLEKEGHRPLLVPDGLAGLETARANPPDLILLDLMLPGLPGTEVCKMLKSGERTVPLPMIMLTAQGEGGHRVTGVAGGG